MRYTMNQLYPTPVYVGKVTDVDLLQDEIDRIYSNIRWISAPSSWGHTHDVTDGRFDGNFIDDYQLTQFKTEILKSVEHYCRNINFKYRDNFDMTSWMTRFTKGSFAKVHTHGAAHLSGCYYYKTNGDDGSLYFESPVPAAESSLAFTHLHTKMNLYKPEVGKLLIFPGWLRHGVTSNNTDNVRHSISFNITFK